jgi:hypothetical protein
MSSFDTIPQRLIVFRHRLNYVAARMMLVMVMEEVEESPSMRVMMGGGGRSYRIVTWCDDVIRIS